MARPLLTESPEISPPSLQVSTKSSTTQSLATRERNYNELYEGCVTARDRLLQTANEYRKRVKQPLINEITTQSWDELDQGVQAACRDLEALAAQDKKPATTTSIEKVKKVFRSFCRHAGAGQTIVSLLPGDMFGFSSVLCAGFKIVFSAMHQTSLYRDAMFRALEELPRVLEDSSELCKLSKFGKDENLHRRCSALFAAVFDALRHILQWFVRSPFVTGIKLVVDPTGFSQKLSERMDDVRLKSQQFWLQAKKLSMHLQVHTTELQQVTSRHVQSIDRRLQLIEVAILGMLEKFDTTPARSTISTDELLAHFPRPSIMPPETSTTTAVKLNLDAVLGDFCYEPDMIDHDCDDILKVLRPSRRHSSAKDFEEERVVAMQSNLRLRAWLVLNRSSMLLLNGRTASQPRSEVSVVTAKIASRLLELYDGQTNAYEDLPLVIPLIFFCGQHRNDLNGTASELAMSLLLQLVDKGRSVLQLADQPLIGQRFRELLTKSEDMDAICTLIHMLFAQLPQNVFVVVIVDGLRFFSNPPRREVETREVISRLVSMFRESSTISATLKFLFASTARSEALEYLFDEHEILHMQRALPDVRSDNDGTWRRPMELEFTPM